MFLVQKLSAKGFHEERQILLFQLVPFLFSLYCIEQVSPCALSKYHTIALYATLIIFEPLSRQVLPPLTSFDTSPSLRSFKRIISTINTVFHHQQYLNNFSIKSICVNTILRQQYRFSPNLSRASLPRSTFAQNREKVPFRVFLHVQQILFPFVTDDLFSVSQEDCQ
jgi:hypothetical protein